MKHVTTCLLALGLTGCASATAAKAPASAAARPVPAAAAPSAAPVGAPSGAAADTTRRGTPGLKPFAEVTRGAEHRAGFLDTYEKGDQLFLAIPGDRLGKDFLLSYQIAQGIGAAGVYGGTMLNIFEGSIVALERRGDRVFLVRRPTRFTAPEGSPAARAVELSFGSSVLESAKIESVRDDGTVLVNVYDWMVSDLSGVGDRLRVALATRPGTPPPVAFEKGRSRLESVKAFPENLNIRAKLTYRPSQPVGLPSVPDGRYLPVTVAYVFAELPQAPMEPRLADDRVGYFLTVRKDFSRDDAGFFVRQINRWRLEPGERVGNLVKPKKPITYHLDPNIPEAYRPYVKAGVEAWNAAFEAAGWKDAIRAEMLPEGADAEDLRYATLRWNTSDQPGYGAIGPSIVDPRTGEILDADILFEASMVGGFKREWRTTVTPAAALEELFAEPTESGEWASLAGEISAQGSLLRAMLAAAEEIGPSDAVPLEYVGEALKWVTMHEVGHTLGLRHNFRSSADTPLEKLHDRGWAEQNGVFSSVMEYPALNLAGRKKPKGYVYNPGVGSYDRWAVTYGYTPDAAHAPRVAREAARPGHAYGTDEDARGPGALDPTVNVYDLGSDPLAWGKERAELIRGIWPDLPRHVLSDNGRYADLTDAFGSLLVQYGRALSTGVKYIGGQYQYRDRVGDPNGRAPFVPVPAAKQREALAFLAEYGFSERAFQVPPAVLAQLGANRWSHWGETNSYGGRIDYPFAENVLALQRALLRQITSPYVFGRIRDAELKFGSRNTLPVPELMSGLTRAVWSEVYGAERNIPALRRDLQRAYLDQLTELVATPPARLPGDARAVARMQLTELNRRIGARLSGGADAYTRAHLAESRARIERALEAGLDVELRSRPATPGGSN
jgi:hypothetical protein